MISNNTIYHMSLSSFSSLAELPSCRLHIAMQTQMIEQMTSAMLSPSYSLFCASIVISTLLSLSYTHDTHKYLTSPPIIHGVLAVCKKITNHISLGAQAVVIKYVKNHVLRKLGHGGW